MTPIRSIYLLFLALFLALGLGCRSVQKVSYPEDANSAHEISRLQLEIDKAIQNQYDILAPYELNLAEEYLKSARLERVNQARVTRLWDAIGMSKAWMNKAREVYNSRLPAARDVLSARQGAINAGARIWDRSDRELKALDQSFRSAAADLAGNIKTRDRLAADYRGVEVIAVQEVQIGTAQSRIQEARDFGAETYAPASLNEAESSLRMAKAAIARNPRQPALFGEKVSYANLAARHLVEINALARNASARSNEDLAREIAAQKRASHDLQTELRGTELESEVKGRALRSTAAELDAVNRQLDSQKQLDQALNDIRHKFTSDEADVYRDGDRLLIRLKKMDFKPGSADLPGQAAPLLTKVKAAIREVHAKDVVVQGHADATGSPKINRKVAKARAETVKDYLESDLGVPQVSAVGLSASRPIRSNKTSEGRATNRRVDLLITPSQPTPVSR